MRKEKLSSLINENIVISLLPKDGICNASQGIYGGNYTYYTDNKPADYVKLLTDRLLYRPGQTVYVKGIAYEQQLDTANVLANRTYTLTLTDANRQEVGRRELRTNDFGSLQQILHCPLPV